MAQFRERWTRGAGNGIGLSSHKNQFRLGVAIDNWVEDSSKVQDTLSGMDGGVFGTTNPNAGVPGYTTASLSFGLEGKIGEELLEAADRKDKDIGFKYRGVPREMKFNHGLGSNPYSTCYATLNELTYGPKVAGQPQVHKLLWSGSKFNDFKVPTFETGTRRPAVPALAPAANPYETHSHADSARVAALARELATTKRDSIKTSTVAEGGQAATVGRKATGMFVKSCDQAYQKIGLRT